MKIEYSKWDGRRHWHFDVEFLGEDLHGINVTDRPRQSEDGVKAIDLDLDVVGWRDGRVELEDEDEFVIHSERYGYPVATVAAARATAQDLMAAIASGDEPFRSAHRTWARRVLALGDPR